LSWSTKKSWVDLQEASFLIFTFFTAFLVVFIIVSMSRMRGVKRRRVRGRWTSRPTVVKSEAAKACVSIPLLHQIFHFKASHPFFKRLNFWGLFFLGSNKRARRLQIQVRVDFLDRLGVFLSCTSFMLSLHIGDVLGLAHPKEQVQYLSNRR
jgi:hypothetical protein